ncbi:MAG: diphosphomevalonate decarboxylase [Gammaproteobacteria bacterium]|nr:diphosphomevalonate decarboxylase [Gammaproteobacteria bacterium]
MNRLEVVQAILAAANKATTKNTGYGKAAPNIALVKYWGKANADLHLPANSNISIGLPSKQVEIILSAATDDQVIINEQEFAKDSDVVKNNLAFLDLFRSQKMPLAINAKMNFAAASGLASSAAWYAALVLALNDYFAWDLSLEKLSILARLGSGSACRSMWPGFVAWPKAKQSDGMDSHGKRLGTVWPALRLGILTLSREPKSISSREGMARCVETSSLFAKWVEQAEMDYQTIQAYIEAQDFTAMGKLAEQNAIAMHAVCQAADPSLVYSTQATQQAIEKVWQLRETGIEVYFTQDAGANLILLFLAGSADAVMAVFPQLEIVAPFGF